MKCPNCEHKIDESQVKIQEVLEKFNFENVHKAMKVLDWTWHDTKGKTPTVKQMKELAEYLFKKAMNNGIGNCGTGGFMAFYFKETNDFALEFTLERWDTE